jgi:predicted nucleotide-binding protein (sugar kinase/HSP70/actin superfamily)
MSRIGMPRALSFYQHFPLWRTFFENLDVELVVTPPTQRDIVAAGAQVVADVTCLPIKVYAGHVIWLRDHGQVDAVFTPAIRSVKKNALHCAKFQGLPDIIKATVPNCPPLLDIEIDMHRRNISPADAFKNLGRRFTWNPLKIQRAWDEACRVDERYRRLLVSDQLTYPEALARLYPSEWKVPELPQKADMTVALVGHPYCLYDDYINHDLIARLRGLGVRVLTSEMVAPELAQTGINVTTGQTRWFFENTMSGAGGYYLQQPQVDGLISVLAFTCGPDSAMVETLNRRAHVTGRTSMSLVLDEHGSAAGMITRLEAFVDMLMRQNRTSVSKQAADAVKPGAPIAIPEVLRESKKPVLGFPRMGTVTIPLKSLFGGLGARVEMGPELSSQTLSLGVRNSPEFMCTPYKYVLGNMIECLDSGANTLIYMDGPELCRNSVYTQLMIDRLHDMGYKFNFVTTALLDDKVVGLAKFIRQFSPDITWRQVIYEIRLAMAKMTTLDAVERRVQFVRAREIQIGSVDKVWEEGMLRLDETHDLGAVKSIQADLIRKIESTPMDPTRNPVKIATTGEYYAVLEPFFNLDLERELGKLGAEVHRTLMMGDWALGMLIMEAMGFPRKPHIDKAAKPYLRWDVAGEGWVTVGQAVIHAKKGFDGLVETLPFTCIPEITALNILPKISSEYNLPMISFIFDEQTGRAGMKTRLEAFVDLLVRRREFNLAAQGRN